MGDAEAHRPRTRRARGRPHPEGDDGAAAAARRSARRRHRSRARVRVRVRLNKAAEGAGMARTMPDDDAIREALRAVDDPEAGMNIVDLGLVYEVDVSDEAVRVAMTMTTAACPMTDMI